MHSETDLIFAVLPLVAVVLVAFWRMLRDSPTQDPYQATIEAKIPEVARLYAEAESETVTNIFTKPRKHLLPELATKLCYTASGWIVGGAAREDEPRDYDIAVPLAYWPIAAQLIPRDARPNAFGGWKCVSEGKTVDVWPADLGVLMTNAMVTDLWHPQSGKRFTAK
jgi:hypothetical protein